MYPTMPHMKCIPDVCRRAVIPAAILRLPAFFNLPRFGEIRYQLPLTVTASMRPALQALPGARMSRSTTSTDKPRSFVVIPARYASTRLPRKMLLRETGKTLLQHTYEAACAARKPAGVIVATDHAEIAREVERFRGDFVMTSPDCASGTDRVAEVARKMPRADILVNVQGDEPEMSPDNIDRVIELLEQNPSAGMATLATPMPSPEQLRRIRPA